MKKVLLISPPAHGLKDKISYPPLGLLYLASNLRVPCEVEVLNMLEQEEEARYDFDIFGISIHSVSTFLPAQKLSRKIRSANKDAPIIMGGSFPTSMSEYTLKNTDADVVVMGEGERVFSDICGMDSFDAKDLERVRGIAYKSDSGIFSNPLEELVKNLDDLKFPARHLLPRNMIRHEGKVHHSDKPATTLFATRGCAFNCSFCDTNLWRRKWRSRTPENIIAEIEEVKKEYDVHWFRFPDDCITLSKKWFHDFCRKIRKCNIGWTVLSRSDAIDLETLGLMKEAGCEEIFFGFESGSQKLLDAMQKKVTVEQNIKAIELCRRAGITSCAYMMFGFPGEDETTVEETKQFLSKAAPDKTRISTFIPIPGTDVWNNPEKYNIKIKDNFTDYWYFDSPDFGLEYQYIGNDKMEELRRDIMNFYGEQGYFKEWTAAK